MRILKKFLQLIIIVATVILIFNISDWNEGKSTAIVISAVSLLISVASPLLSYLSYRRAVYDDYPSFNIVQNLWSKSPNYILYNESKKKLAEPPHPTYVMVIPSKVLSIDGDNVESVVVLSPVSYENVTEQTSSGKSIGSIETSTLPINFFAKKGERNMVISENIPVDDFKMKVITYPMLVIFSRIDYRFWGSSKILSNFIVTTPVGKYEISPNDYDSVFDYITDNADLEAKIKGDESIYESANKIVTSHVKKLFDSSEEHSDKDLYFMGGKEGGYGFILKKLQGILPVDPLVNRDK
ncbi:hypothetical protein [Lactiplantibacillus pentosus]|uniref:hypothetical protein n=1 Tax=Lactiplantibacillus pentosus TaxID=1589 RepID=UPI0021820364|nr:hypothetical protein [Lactiplantibacillus pentosus]MCT0162922.1 hypothetical protein [Lactiplantibacillus pentosus]